MKHTLITILGLTLSTQLFAFTALPSASDYEGRPDRYFDACLDTGKSEAFCTAATEQSYPETREDETQVADASDAQAE